MIIRLNTGAKIDGVLQYNDQKVSQNQAHVLSTKGFANNKLALNNKSYATQVLENQSRKNTNVRKPAVHISLSLHPSEQVNDDTFSAIAHQFMSEIGYPNQPYVIYRHQDRPHPHIHIVTICVTESGEKINDSFIKRRVNTARERLEIQFNLIVAQGRGKVNSVNQSQSKSIEQVSRLDNLERKDQLVATLRQAFQQVTFNDIDEFRALLKKQHVHIVLHQSRVGGGQIRGISYQLVDKVGKPNTPRIKASELGDWATWKAIEDRFGERHVQQEPTQPGQLTPEQLRVVQAKLSEQLQDYKKEHRIYYDSALIENFPTLTMQTRLQAIAGDKLSSDEIAEAVRLFEKKKHSQLAEIIKKEQAIFAHTMGIYTQIASEIV